MLTLCTQALLEHALSYRREFVHVFLGGVASLGQSWTGQPRLKRGREGGEGRGPVGGEGRGLVGGERRGPVGGKRREN